MKKNNEKTYTRDQLIEFLEMLRKLGVFQHVVHQKKPFEDKYLFFRFTHLIDKPETLKNIFVPNYEDVVKIRKILKSETEIMDFQYKLSDPEIGIEIIDRSYHYKVYKSCFVATDAVIWISKYYSISITAAIYLGDAFRQLGMIRHVVDEKKPFQDAYLFFIVNEEDIAIKLVEKRHSKFLESKFVGVFRYEIGISEEQQENMKETMEFGIDPELVMERVVETSEMPHVYEELLNHISNNGIDVQGIFRISGDADDISEYRLRYDYGEKVELKDLDIHTGLFSFQFLISKVASLFKLYLKIMTEPIIPFDIYKKLENSMSKLETFIFIQFLKNLKKVTKKN